MGPVRSHLDIEPRFCPNGAISDRDNARCSDVQFVFLGHIVWFLVLVLVVVVADCYVVYYSSCCACSLFDAAVVAGGIVSILSTVLYCWLSNQAGHYQI